MKLTKLFHYSRTYHLTSTLGLTLVILYFRFEEIERRKDVEKPSY